MSNPENESEEEKEIRFAKNLRTWFKKAKQEGLEEMKGLFEGLLIPQAVISKKTFFDLRHPEYTFELSLLVRKRSNED